MSGKRQGEVQEERKNRGPNIRRKTGGKGNEGRPKGRSLGKGRPGKKLRRENYIPLNLNQRIIK